MNELQIERERHRKTWRQLEQVTGLLREMRYAMNRYEADCDEYPPFHHNQMMDRVGAALSQQAEPLEPAPAQDERGDELEAIHQYAFEVGGTEGGRYMLEPEELDEVARRAREPYEDVLRSLACSLGAGGYNALTVDPAVFEQKIRWGIDQLTRPAQTEQQPVCWASSTALAKLRNGRNNSPCVLTDGPAEFNDTPLYTHPHP